jgi:tetratricopeptide (TPR) repeat protein
LHMKMYVKALGLVGALALTAGLAACKEEPPSPAKVHLMAGDKHRVASAWKEAAEEYGKSLEADPKQEKVWETKAYCHQQAGDTEGAVATLMKWSETKTDPAEKAKLIRFCADLWKQNSNLEKAEAAYLEAVKALPTDDESYTWLAEIYATRGGARDMKAAPAPAALEKALEYYDKVVAIKPDNPNTYVNQRVIMYKYIEHYKKQKTDAEAEAQTFEKSKDKDAKEKMEAAKAKAEKAQAAIDETQKKIDATTAKWTAAKEKAAAAASAAAAAPPPPASATKK